ncbi:MAG: biopolymer transporter ExbD [Phycisphaerae bacterium]|nr:biopolymer transporter ExbD [Phycisphaerales bacterium]
MQTMLEGENHPHRYRRKRKGNAPLVLNLAPMIDVTFLLLIFFSVTTTFRKAEGFLAAKLPHDAGRPVVAMPISPIIVRIEPADVGIGGYQLRVDHFTNAPATAGELVGFLREIHAQPGFNEETPVVLAATPDVAWDHVVACWNAALRANCKNISFGRQ